MPLHYEYDAAGGMTIKYESYVIFGCSMYYTYDYGNRIKTQTEYYKDAGGTMKSLLEKTFTYNSLGLPEQEADAYGNGTSYNFV